MYQKLGRSQNQNSNSQKVYEIFFKQRYFLRALHTAGSSVPYIPLSRCQRLAGLNGFKIINVNHQCVGVFFLVLPFTFDFKYSLMLSFRKLLSANISASGGLSFGHWKMTER